MNIYEIPLTNDAQIFSIDLAGIEYQINLYWCDAAGIWVIDLADNATGVAILSGVPLVAGPDLLAQFAYLRIGGKLSAYTEGNINSAPTYDNLGVTGKVTFTTS
jgi:hypothetical protein